MGLVSIVVSMGMLLSCTAVTLLCEGACKIVERLSERCFLRHSPADWCEETGSRVGLTGRLAGAGTPLFVEACTGALAEPGHRPAGQAVAPAGGHPADRDAPGRP